MDDKLFSELLESVEEGGKIVKGEKEPGRKFVFDSLAIKKIRTDFGNTQVEFAKMMGVSVKTLRNWEQGIRKPEGPARALLTVTAKYPKVVKKALL